MAIEVSKNASFPVVVRYYTQGGGPHPLGTVWSNQRQTFMLPVSVAGHIRVETESGKIVPHSAHLVKIQRYKVDRVTGKRIG